MYKISRYTYSVYLQEYFKHVFQNQQNLNSTDFNGTLFILRCKTGRTQKMYYLILDDYFNIQLQPGIK